MTVTWAVPVLPAVVSVIGEALIGTPLSKKVTVPVGAVVPDAGETVAVNVIDTPAVVGVPTALDVTVVVVFVPVTVWSNDPDPFT
jgi:hypothetical protein